jgi:hypothetical protein
MFLLVSIVVPPEPVMAISNQVVLPPLPLPANELKVIKNEVVSKTICLRMF